MIDLNELKDKASKATPGPWEHWTSNSEHRIVGAGDVHGDVIWGERYAGKDSHSTIAQHCSGDFDFIAAMNPAVALSLISEIETLRADRDKVRREAFADGMYEVYRSEYIPDDIGYGYSRLAEEIRSGAIPIPNAGMGE